MNWIKQFFKIYGDQICSIHQQESVTSIYRLFKKESGGADSGVPGVYGSIRDELSVILGVNPFEARSVGLYFYLPWSWQRASAD